MPIWPTYTPTLSHCKPNECPVASCNVATAPPCMTPFSTPRLCNTVYERERERVCAPDASCKAASCAFKALCCRTAASASKTTAKVVPGPHCHALGSQLPCLASSSCKPCTDKWRRASSCGDRPSSLWQRRAALSNAKQRLATPSNAEQTLATPRSP